MATIDAVPNEMLSTFFEYFAECCEGLGPVQQLMLVCRRWNEVAQSTPGIWTTIELDGQSSLAQLDSQLRRSGAMPLNLKVTLFEAEGTGMEASMTLNCLFEHAYHFASLKIRADPQSMPEIVQRMALRTFPLLHNLELIPMKLPGAAYILPSVLLLTGLPALRTLSVAFFTGAFTVLTGLRSVALDGASMSVYELLSMLESNAQLQRLHLRLTLCQPRPHEQAMHRLVRLPYLQRLVLDELGGPSVELLEHLDFPFNAQICLLPHQVGDAEELNPIIQPLLKHLRDAPAAYVAPATMLTLNVVEIEPQWYFDIMVFARTEFPPHPTTGARTDELVRMVVYPRIEEDHFPLLRVILGHDGPLFTHLQTITHVDLRSAHLQKDAFRFLLDLLLCSGSQIVLEEIAITVGQSGDKFCEAMYEQILEIQESRATVALPLRRILLDVDLSKKKIRRALLNPSHDHYAFIGTLVKLLRALCSLKNSQKSLERITIQQEWLPPYFRDLVQEWPEQEDRDYRARWIPVKELVDELVWRL
ncbi:hypothetical protein C8F01DRAFT_669462 [Mycena amicta]|nr:hypothetical protein C8F01DRAFT_669462 [Mycena amicta]